MSINPFIAPLSLKIKPSMQKILLIALPHLLVLIVVLQINVFTLNLKLLLTVLIIASAYYYSRFHYFFRSKSSVIELRQDSKKNWLIATVLNHESGDVFSVELLPSSFISQWLIILNFIDNSHSHYTIIITPDCISANDFRHLTVRLKLTNVKKS